MPAAIILTTGQKFGKWTVLTQAETFCGKRRFLCRCDCGNSGIVPAASLHAGYSKSCGCLRSELAGTRNRTHGRSTSKVYDVWQQMRGKCYRSTHKDFKYYGARGITVCERWLSFENFLSDMGEPQQGLTLERHNNDGNYEPGNCSWESRLIQANNSRQIVRVSESAGTFSISEFSRRNGLPYNPTRKAIKKGRRVFANKTIIVEYSRKQA